MSAETLTYDQIAQRMNLMAAREVTSRLEGEIAGLRTPRQTVVPTGRAAPVMVALAQGRVS